MTYANETIGNYLDALASRTPAPGGGSAGARGGAVGAAVAGMVAAYTLGNDKYRAVETQVRQLERQMAEARAAFLALADADAAAYSRFTAARALPKKNDAERATRSAAIAEAREAATVVPEEIVARQKDFMDHGVANLKPLTMVQVAEVVGVH